MRAEILDEEGSVINTIIADLDFLEANYQGRYRIVGDPLPDTRTHTQMEIDQLERDSLMNRGIRELALRIMEDRAVTMAAEQGITTDEVLASVPAYVKFKALDDQISALRTQL